MPGPKSHHKLYYRNPNPGQTCVCSPDQHEQDCKPPYIMFTHAELVSGTNPHVVMCAECALSAAAKCVRAKPSLAPEPEPLPAPAMDISSTLAAATQAQLINALAASAVEQG